MKWHSYCCIDSFRPTDLIKYLKFYFCLKSEQFRNYRWIIKLLQENRAIKAQVPADLPQHAEHRLWSCSC